MTHHSLSDALWGRAYDVYAFSPALSQRPEQQAARNGLYSALRAGDAGLIVEALGDYCRAYGRDARGELVSAKMHLLHEAGRLVDEIGDWMDERMTA